jgi:hypothetical protein
MTTLTDVITLDVTQLDIDNAPFNDGQVSRMRSCPIAQSLIREGYELDYVGTQVVGLSAAGSRCLYEIDEAGKRFVNASDIPRPVSPITITLTRIDR